MTRTDDITRVAINQQGQTLGRKGLQTRQKLMAAARKLLDVYSPVELTAVSIAKEAGTSSASFYMYFEDVRDILYALTAEAAVDMAAVHDTVKQPWTHDVVHAKALVLVEQFNGVWERHRQVLRFRNMEADRGDPRFEALRMSTYVPFIDLLARQLIAACPSEQTRPTLGQAFALASVLHAAMERLASTDPAVVARGVGAHKLNDALAHVIQSVFNAGAPGAPPAAGGVQRKAPRKAGQTAAQKPAQLLAQKPALKAARANKPAD